MLHFNDMKQDHDGTVRKIADFLGFAPTEEQWPKVLEYTSFEWMKAHEEKFEVGTLLPFPLIEKGGMVRKGQSGKAAGRHDARDRSAHPQLGRQDGAGRG